MNESSGRLHIDIADDTKMVAISITDDKGIHHAIFIDFVTARNIAHYILEHCDAYSHSNDS
jgi:hypothetical protein